MSKLAALEHRVDTLKSQAAPESSPPAVLQTYSNAVRQWKNAVLVLQEPVPDRRRSSKCCPWGDKFRTQAIEEFQRRFASRSGSQQQG